MTVHLVTILVMLITSCQDVKHLDLLTKLPPHFLPSVQYFCSRQVSSPPHLAQTNLKIFPADVTCRLKVMKIIPAPFFLPFYLSTFLPSSLPCNIKLFNIKLISHLRRSGRSCLSPKTRLPAHSLTRSLAHFLQIIHINQSILETSPDDLNTFLKLL